MYYCNPRQSQQKGACERNHVEIRKMLPKWRGISFDDLDEADACFVGSNVNSEPRRSLMGLTPLAMLRAAEPDLTGAVAERLGILELRYGELSLTLAAANVFCQPLLSRLPSRNPEPPSVTATLVAESSVTDN